MIFELLHDWQMKKSDILSRFLEMKKTDPKYLKDIILSFIIAGKDTTASTLSWFFYMMCKHPLLQERIAEEVRKATGTNEYSSIDELPNSITDAALDKMQYLHASLTETLRLYLAIPVVIHKYSKNDINKQEMSLGQCFMHVPLFICILEQHLQMNHAYI